jgi:diphthamide synthase (EF-2-diphthine--ammonia ligase)
LIEEFFQLGFGTVICCANDAFLDESAVGRTIDREFIASLPANVDPCGENGEYHSFAFAGPVFREPIRFTIGEKIYRPVEMTHPASSGSSAQVCPTAGPSRTRGFWFCDLLPVSQPALEIKL